MNARDAIFRAFCEHHRCCGMAGPALIALRGLAESAGVDADYLGYLQARRLREWAAVLELAATMMEDSKNESK